MQKKSRKVWKRKRVSRERSKAYDVTRPSLHRFEKLLAVFGAIVQKSRSGRKRIPGEEVEEGVVNVREKLLPGSDL